jgi:hypothetical protein
MVIIVNSTIFVTANEPRDKLLKLRHEIMNHPVHTLFLSQFSG